MADIGKLALYQIGDKVKVQAIYVLEYNDLDQRYVSRKPIKPCEGWIAGQKMKRTGTLHRSAEHTEQKLTDTKTIVFWEVRFSLQNKPYLCAAEDLALVSPAIHVEQIPVESLDQARRPSRQKKAIITIAPITRVRIPVLLRLLPWEERTQVNSSPRGKTGKFIRDTEVI